MHCWKSQQYPTIIRDGSQLLDHMSHMWNVLWTSLDWFQICQYCRMSHNLSAPIASSPPQPPNGPNLFRKLDPKEPISKSAKGLSLAATRLPPFRKWQKMAGGIRWLSYAAPAPGRPAARQWSCDDEKIESLGTWGYSEELSGFAKVLVTLMSPPGRVRNSCYKVAASTQAASNLGEQSSQHLVFLRILYLRFMPANGSWHPDSNLTSEPLPWLQQSQQLK